ncbi:Flp pilus assembly protein CpaB [Blastococcus montanus]|uniref:Flp pilus assembly protein CpaB n=1 Tax=Blastococcus montanus TaxID=3144973 RepID=UPI003209A6E9
MPRLRLPRSPLLLARRATAAALLALAVALALRPAPAPADGQPAATSPVVVAAADLPAGTTLTAEHLVVVPLPRAAVPAGVVDAPHLLRHRVLAGAVRRGEPLSDARLVGPGLTSALPDGQVAAPVRLADLAVARLVRAGDRVDVLATGTGTGTAERVAAGALVLAAPGQDGGDDAPGAGLLLLAVDAGTAARLAAASAGATLTVSLPPP